MPKAVWNLDASNLHRIRRVIIKAKALIEALVSLVMVIDIQPRLYGALSVEVDQTLGADCFADSFN